MSVEIPGFHAVIPAGGAGTRLWPVSRAGSPKFLHDLTGAGRTLIQQTYDRLVPLAGDRILIVTGVAHADGVRAQLPRLGANDVLAEPSPRDSMAAIGLAAAVLEARDPEAVLGSFAADHLISQEGSFHTAIAEAVSVAQGGQLVTIGITPTHPATGFGYIQCGRPVPGAASARHVRQFVEKPNHERASAYVATGEFLWNAGMFVVQAASLLDMLARWDAGFATTLRTIAAAPERLDELWPTLPKIAIDHAIAEPAADLGLVVVVPGPFGWDDIGDFASLAGILPAPDDGPTIIGDPGKVTAVEAGGLVVIEGDRMVSIVGIPDVVVVDTPDALLVTSTQRAQNVKLIVDALRAAGRTDLL